MGNWVRRVRHRLFQTSSTGAADTGSATITYASDLPATTLWPASAAPVAPDDQAAAPGMDLQLFDWLLGLPIGPDTAETADESRWLAALDPLIAADKGRGDLLPRAAGLIPQLLSSLRDEGESMQVLAQRVARDPHLVAELTRLANSVAFRGSAPVQELADVLNRVGLGGVHQAIAKVLLRPMFEADAGALSSRAAGRLWQLAQLQADLCRALAVARGLTPFDAYLGGLLHNVGWTAGFRALDRVRDLAEPRFGTGFKQGFQARRERLYVQLVTGWRANAALHAAARDVQAAGGFAQARHPLAQLLREGERLASLRVLAAAGRVPAGDEAALLADLPGGVKAAYDAAG